MSQNGEHKQSTPGVDPLSMIDLSALPAWDFSMRVRGIDIPTVSPLDAPEINAAELPSQAAIDARTKRWPGLFVWLWRAIMGGPRINADDLPGDGGAAYIRKVCRAILGEHHGQTVEGMSCGECAQLVAGYMAMQEEWLLACRMVVRDRASEHLRRSHPDVGRGGGAGTGVPEGFEPLVPGKVDLRNGYAPMVRADGGDV